MNSINQVTIGGTSPASFWRKLGIRLLQKLSLPAMLCTLLRFDPPEACVLGFSPCQKNRHMYFFTS